MSRPEINVTPLIDVLLVLLIIFMVVTPTKPSAFKTRVPRKPDNKSTAALPHPDTLVVSISVDSTLSLNHEAGLGSAADTRKMTDRLAAIFQERTDNYQFSSSGEAVIPKNVFIRAPRGLDYGSVARVVDAVKMSGAAPIALQIDEIN